MGDWRLIALDLDGTLLNEEGYISEENQKWIQIARRSGLEITIATGRPIHHVKPLIESLGLTCPFVTVNGSEIWTADGMIMERRTFGIDQVFFLHELAVEYGIRFWFSVADTVLTPGVWPEKAENYKWLKFGYSCKDPIIIQEIWSTLHKHGGLEVSSSNSFNIEVNPFGVSKETGLVRVCDDLGMLPNQVVAVGDGLNDIKMLKWAGLGVAMENASEEVKESANWVTGSNQNDGVAMLIRFLLS